MLNNCRSLAVLIPWLLISCGGTELNSVPGDPPDDDDGVANDDGADGADNAPPPIDLAPTAVLEITPTIGAAPLFLTADASMSTDPEDATTALMARWDYNGDGNWETPFSNALIVNASFSTPGQYEVTVEVQDTAGNRATASATLTVEAPTVVVTIANIDADVDRDGLVTTADDFAEDTWTSARGAVVIGNLDDDDGDGSRDRNDAIINGLDDRADMTRLVLRRTELSAGMFAALSISPNTAAERLRIFSTSGEVVLDAGGGSVTLDVSALASTDIELLMESTTGRTDLWDGNATVRFSIYNGSTLVSQDSVAIRAAPTILPDNTRVAQVLYVMRIGRAFNGPNLPFFNAIVANLPASIGLYAVDEDAYGADRWVQDNMQTGYQELPTVSGRRQQMTYLQTQRPTGFNGLEALVPIGLVGKDLGYVFNGGGQTSLNYGGNLEVAPPHPGYPLGRILVGGGDQGTLAGADLSDHMTWPQVAWLDAQEVQGPVVELSTEWLAVGHLDEIFMAVPHPTRAGSRQWMYVIASPAMARQALVDLSGQGYGFLTVFAGRETQTTVDDILADSGLMAYNQAAQARIDSVRFGLISNLGLTNADFIDVPVLFEWFMYGGADLGAAYNPGIQNMVVAEPVLFIPDPEGPVGPSGDVWKNMTDAALAPLGHRLVYVDVFDSYHLFLGEAHCGTNFERAAYDIPWWEVEL